MPAPPQSRQASSGQASSRQASSRQEQINEVLVYLMLAQSIVFTEAGSLPALLIPLTTDFNLTFPQQGFLGGIVYLGIAVGAAAMAGVFKRFSAHRVLTASIATTAAMILVFGLVPAGAPNLLIFVRFCIGFGQATLSIFSPVWIERFAPKQHATKWMSWLQITVPLGIMVGYLFGWGAVALQTGVGPGKACFNDTFACWRVSFVVQAALIAPVVYRFMRLDPSCLDVDFRPRGMVLARSDGDDGSSRGGGGVGGAVVALGMAAHCADVWSIVREFYFTVVVLLIAMMYYLVMSIQYWGTDWLVVGRG
jgi:MFS family permease